MLVALVADIHANLPALLAVYRDIDRVEEERAQRVEGIWCMGDIAGYGPHLSAVLLAILDSPRPWVAVRGNHDDALLDAYAASGAIDLGGEPRGRHAAVEAIRLQSMEVPPTHRGVEWIRACPETAEPAAGVLLIHPNHAGHGMHSGSEPSETTLSVLEEHARLVARTARSQSLVVFRGHTHVPTCFTRATPGAEWVRRHPDGAIHIPHDGWINPGSVGESRVVDDARAHYALWDPVRREVSFRRVKYPTRGVRMAARGRYELLPAWRSDSPMPEEPPPASEAGPPR